MKLELTRGEIPNHLLKYFRSVAHKPKDEVDIGGVFAEAMRRDGWYRRETIIWQKPNPMPASVKDRCTNSHEYIFHFTKQPRYWYDAQAVAEEAVDTSPGGRFTTRQADGIGRAPTGNQLPERSKAYVRKPERNRRSVWTINPANFRDWTETVRRHPVSVHELSGGTKRIASPDCPVHGSKDRPGSIYVCDAHEADELSRNAGIYARRVQAQFAGSASTDQNHVSGLQEQSSGLLPPDRVPSATLHNTQSHRTAPAPATTLPYTPSGETASHTGDTSTEPAYVAPHPDTLVNSTSQGAPDAHSPGQTSGDTVGILSSVSLPCTCQFYRETTEKTSHFATFPEDIPEICIKAACPESGVVLDPFAGAGTVALVAKRLNRRYIGCDLNAEYVEMARRRVDSIPYTLFSLMTASD